MLEWLASWSEVLLYISRVPEWHIQFSALPVCSSPNSLILMWSACWNEWRADVKSSFANCAFPVNTRNCQLCLNALLQTAWVLCQVHVGMTEELMRSRVVNFARSLYWETHSNCQLFLYIRLLKVWFWFVQFVSFADWRADFKSSCAYCASPSNRKHSAVLECSSPKGLSLMSSTRWYDWRACVMSPNARREPEWKVAFSSVFFSRHFQPDVKGTPCRLKSWYKVAIGLLNTPAAFSCAWVFFSK